jgi:hypothetical protein
VIRPRRPSPFGPFSSIGNNFNKMVDRDLRAVCYGLGCRGGGRSSVNSTSFDPRNSGCRNRSVGDQLLSSVIIITQPVRTVLGPGIASKILNPY